MKLDKSDFELHLIAWAFPLITSSGRVQRQHAFGEIRADITIELPFMRPDGRGRYSLSDDD